MYGNGGMNTDWKQVNNTSQSACPGATGVFCDGRTDIDMAQAFIVGTYAHSVDHGRYSLGISPIFAAQTFKARGLDSFGQAGISSDPNHISNTGRDYSFGAGFRVGGQEELISGLRLGASYKSRIYMSKFERYSGLFAQGAVSIFPTVLMWVCHGMSMTKSPRILMSNTSATAKSNRSEIPSRAVGC